MKHLPLLFLLVVFAACHGAGSSTGQTDSASLAPSSTDTASVVTYSGTLPCADCEGIVTELTLQKNQDNHFLLKETYQGKNQTFPSEGNYKVVHGTSSDPGATVIQLNPDKDRNLQRYFQQVDNNELRLLDSDQKTIQSANNYTLKRVL